jgi:RNA polymerase sigma-70 factor (ECF subfamily)
VNDSSRTSTDLLIGRARQGDSAALDNLVARQLPALRQWASGRLPGWARGVADTDDLIQDALVGTVRRIDRFSARGPGALAAYLRQAIINRLRDELRRQARRPVSMEMDGVAGSVGGSPLDLAINAESVARYERALARLRPRERELIVARLELGFTYDELATWTGKASADAARKGAERALVRLMDEMSRSVSG